MEKTGRINWNRVAGEGVGGDPLASDGSTGIGDRRGYRDPSPRIAKI